MEQLDLNELGRRHGTDKSSFGKRGGADGVGHDYLRFYARFLEPRRLSTRKVLEIGVQRGASLRMWRDYFPDAVIYGLDIQESALTAAGERIDVRLVDQSDVVALEAFAREVGPFDVVVEDGSHVWLHQIISLQTLLPHVVPGGVYVVEDLHTSYSAEFGAPGSTTGIEYVLRCAEKVIGRDRMRHHGNDDGFLRLLSDRVDSMAVYRRSAVFFLSEVARTT